MINKTLPPQIELRATVQTVVAFHDADPAGVAWHGNHFKYFDLARCAMMDKIGYDYRKMVEEGVYWPVVSTEVKYLRPLPYHSMITIHGRLLEWEYRLKIGYEIYDAQGAKAVTAQTTQVAVNATSGEMQIGAPEPLRRRLRQYLDGQAELI